VVRGALVTGFGLLLTALAVTANDFARTPAELLGRMDADADGRVGLPEYQDYLSYGFRAMDRNQNQVVDLDEYPAHTRNGRTRPLPLARHQDNLAATFRRQDADRDGYLDPRELASPPR